MKVLVLLHDSYGAVGGIAKFNRDLLGALNRDSRVGEIIALPRVAPSEEPPPLSKLRLQPLPVGGKIGYFAAAVAQHTKPRRADLIIAGHLRLLPAAFAARSSRRPLWLIAHGIDVWTPQHLSSEEKSALEKLSKSPNFQPSPDKNEKSFFDKVREMFS